METGSVTPANRPYLLPSLKPLQDGPWTVAPGGLVLYLPAHPSVVMRFDEATQRQRVFGNIEPGEKPNLLNVTPDGRSVLYSTVGRLTAEIDLLTADGSGRLG